MTKDHTKIIEIIKKTAEYKAIIDLGLTDVSTLKNMQRGSIFFKTPIPHNNGIIPYLLYDKIKEYYEYSIYKTGFLRLYNPITGRYSVYKQIKLENSNLDIPLTDKNIYINPNLISQYTILLKALPRIYNRKAKKEGLFAERELLQSIPKIDLPKHITCKWKFPIIRHEYLNLLKQCNKKPETVTV